MSMSRDPENFEQLCRLLKIKRYEQPPPGYFHQFSSQVIARIKEGDRAEERDIFERLLWDAPWLQRIFSAFEAKPVFAGAFGIAMCALLVSGIVYSEKTDVQPIALIPVTRPATESPLMANMTAPSHPFLGKPSGLEPSSTNPIAGLQPEGPLFGDLHAQPVSFTLPGGN
jgi:hypothetical protein